MLAGRAFHIAIPLLLLCWFAAGWSAAAVATGDVAGSADHPLIGRFEGSVINYYDRKDFDEYEFVTGPIRRGKPKPAEAIEGQKTRIAYKLAPGPSIAEVFRNYRIKLEQSGFEVLYQCKDKDCGRGDFSYGIEVLPIPTMTVDPWKFRYLAARKSDDSGQISVSVLVSVDAKKNIRTQVFVLEAEALAFKMIDAAEMAKQISESGRVALYGIYFDTDKATIKSESRPTLQEIAQFLKSQPKLKVIVVGHTDNQGALDYNMALSQRRARSVVQALEGEFGLSPGRLGSAGVGFLAPVATNSSEAGRSLNRRVELIER
ncbi:MAG: DUF4892 domain-containing protein [Alphaproteobacteria bacterium]|jgi:outer membrane protein OmpA-like peptidoglycan-associated protein|nr:DUF4892 domain-containing protein [Alphaproteobacteria bacterium]